MLFFCCLIFVFHPAVLRFFNEERKVSICFSKFPSDDELPCENITNRQAIITGSGTYFFFQKNSDKFGIYVKVMPLSFCKNSKLFTQNMGRERI